MTRRYGKNNHIARLEDVFYNMYYLVLLINKIVEKMETFRDLQNYQA